MSGTYSRNLTLLLNHGLCLYDCKDKVLLLICSESAFREGSASQASLIISVPSQVFVHAELMPNCSGGCFGLKTKQQYMIGLASLTRT